MHSRQIMKVLGILVLILISEAIVLTALIALYLFVERDLCPSEYFASGHCYAHWFGAFEWMFFSVALIVTSSVFFWAFAKGLFNDSPKLIKYTAGITTLLLIAFVAALGLSFFTQAAVAVIFVCCLCYQLLSGIEK